MIFKTLYDNYNESNERFMERLKFYLQDEPPEKVIAVIKYIKYVYWEKVNSDFDEIINALQSKQQ